VRLRILPSLLSLLALADIAACSDSTSPGPVGGAIGAIVLNSVGETGVTILPASGDAPRHIDFGSSFDGVTFTVARDTALSTSSRGGGDQLFIADLQSNTVQIAQMPKASNPGGVTFVPSGAPGSTQGDIVVALRDSGAVAQVQRAAADASAPLQTHLLSNAGRCPYDVAFHGAELWSLDANERCEDNSYARLGAGRLIRVSLTDAGRDTIILPDAALGPLRAFVIGDDAYVFSTGDYTTGAPATFTKVSLTQRRVLGVGLLPPSIVGLGATLGNDGRLYAAAFDFTGFEPHVYAMDPATLTLTGTMAAGVQYLDLVNEDGTQAQCSAATADRDHDVYCVENGSVSASVVVFDATGKFLRSAAAGTSAYDIAIR
jgi:hypothetical protein